MRLSSLVRKSRGFIPATSLLASHRKLRPRRTGSNRRQPQFNLQQKRFQLYNEVNKSWAIQIDQPPILLTEEDIKNWLVFRTNKLKRNQLYFWHATKFDWVPLWASENEFLLINFNKIKYDKINYTQFTKASWIKHNSVKPEAMKLLLKQFQIQTNSVDQMQPIINSTIQNGQVTATGIPYFVDYHDQSHNQIHFNNPNQYEWNVNRWFKSNANGNRFSYQFIKEYKQIFHYSERPQNPSQVTSLKEAMTNAPNGTYIYHEKEAYIPYRINHGHVTFNCGDAMEINRIRNRLNQNRNINTVAQNKMNWKQYQEIYNV